MACNISATAARETCRGKTCLPTKTASTQSPQTSRSSARIWLQNNGHIEEDEAGLMRTFATFAGRAGSHAGLSGAADAQLRRHMATALIAFGVAKLD
jgi:hypothetical protein